MQQSFRVILLALFVPGIALSVRASDDDFFETNVRPILASNCFECHGESDPESGLRLTSRAEILVGGESGPAAVAEKPAESLIVQAIGYANELKMPPDGKLSDDEIAVLTKWVELG